MAHPRGPGCVCAVARVASSWNLVRKMLKTALPALRGSTVQRLVPKVVRSVLLVDTADPLPPRASCAPQAGGRVRAKPGLASCVTRAHATCTGRVAFAARALCNCREGRGRGKVAWRCTPSGYGGQCVLAASMHMPPRSFVRQWGTLRGVLCRLPLGVGTERVGPCCAVPTRLN